MSISFDINIIYGFTSRTKYFILLMAGTKLSEECCKYGAENIDDNILAKAASVYGDARKQMEKEQEDLNRLLLSQVDLPVFICLL